MSIVLDERKWAEDMINESNLGKKPVETLTRIAKYYYQANHYSKREVRQKLDTFLTQCDPSASLPNWSDTLDRAAKKSDKFPLIQIEHIDISTAEMDRIGNLVGKQLRRLAFTLLCAAKYWDSVSDRNDHWVNTQDKEIMKMANINTSIKRQSAMFADLRAAGMVRFSKRIDNLNVQVTFIAGGDPALQIKDFRNLGFQYLMCGEPYFDCEVCGLTVKIKEPGRGRRQKYCPSCAAEVRMKQNVNSVMRRRAAMQNQQN